MKRITTLFLLALFAFSPLVKADEGMWLLMSIDKQTYKEMKKKGLKLTPKQIYDINNASLKDAIIQFGRGCTGEIVSDQGLILTNHHCGYPQIQQHSTVEHDYLSNKEFCCQSWIWQFFALIVSPKTIRKIVVFYG